MASRVWFAAIGILYAATVDGLACNPQCSTYGGSCNPITGECLCPFGRAGPNCQDVLFPACRTSQAHDAIVSCEHPQRLPRSCECLRQCVAHFCDGDVDTMSTKCARTYPRDVACFERVGMPPAQQLSNIPGVDEIRSGKVVWLATYRQNVTLWELTRSRVPKKQLDNGTLVAMTAAEANISDSGPPYVPASHVLSLGSPAGWHAAPEARCGVLGCSGSGVCRVRDPGSEFSSERSRERKSRGAGNSAGGASEGTPSVACACLPGFVGRHCQPSQAPRDASCPLACQGRGTCRFGTCQCQEGSWGPGCAYNLSGWDGLGLSATPRCPQAHITSLRYQHQPLEVSTSNSGRGSTTGVPAGVLDALNKLPSLVERLNRKPAGLSIWMYPLPAHVAWNAVWPRNDAYSCEHLFIEHLLADPEILSQDPRCAHLFLVPALSTWLAGSAAWMNKHEAHITRVLTYVRDNYPFFNKSGGKDHFLWATGDLGPVRWGKANHLLAATIKAAHFSYDHTHTLARLPFKEVWNGSDPVTDVVAVPHDGPRLPPVKPGARGGLRHQLFSEWHDQLMEAYSKGGTPGGLRAARELLNRRPLKLFFAGSLQWRDLSDITYSLGTRQMLGAWVNNFTAEHCPGKAASMATGKATGGDAAAPKQVQSRMLLTVPTQGSTDACLGCDNADQAGEEAGDGYQQGVGGSEFRTTTGRQGPIDWPGTAGRQLAQATQPRVRGSRSAIKADVLSRLAALLEQSCQGVLIVPHGLGAGAAGEDLYLAAMAGSVFCASPPGWGWGVRTSTAIEYGCIPVILQDAIIQPAEELLPYELFSLRFTLADIESGRMWQELNQLLSTNGGRDKLASMLLALAHVRRLFIWSRDHGGRAYELTLHGLALRASHFKS